MKSICVIGAGFVGGSLGTVMAEKGFRVFSYDKTGKVAHGCEPPKFFLTGEIAKNTTDVVRACEQKEGFSSVYFVCLPTPMFEDGSADLSIVEGVLDELASVPGKRIAVVKSTVPPGSTEHWNQKYEGTGLRVVFCPEFLRESSALDDMRNQDRIILGGPRPQINTVKQIFQAAFPKVPIVKTSSTNAELTKYVTNCFLAMKVSFANEIYQLCNALDEAGLNADYDRVIECATLDPRLGKSHWQVPSFETDENGQFLRGFAKVCFPKDLNALICTEKSLGLKPTMLEATWAKNLEVRPQRDWEKMLGRSVSKK
jgi:nucleotide sugar dehydrogenase